MIIRAKTETLFQSGPLTPKRLENTALNIQEMQERKTILQSKPQRLVLELTNMCNINCIMCGRNAAYFKPTYFKMEWFERFQTIFDSIEEVTLMGWGEPTIHPHFPEILRLLHKENLRLYFCTNGMRLSELENTIFSNEIDIIAISLDGADSKTNSKIRRGTDFNKIIHSLQSIVSRKRAGNLSWPYMNFVFTAMKSNLEQLPAMVELAASIGLEEVKVVFLTAFTDELLNETLFSEPELVKKWFALAEERAEQLNIQLKLPYIKGNDPAKNQFHRDCFTAYRDFFLGSDGQVRACMSSPDVLFSIDKYSDFDSMWNSIEFQHWRSCVNTPQTMPRSCRRCYQSSHANWNNRYAYIQMDNVFAPKWE